MKVLKEIGKAIFGLLRIVLGLGLFAIKLTGFFILSVILAFTGIQNMILFWLFIIAYKIIRKMLRSRVGGVTTVTEGEYGPIYTTEF